jgi:hypothetical protein
MFIGSLLGPLPQSYKIHIGGAGPSKYGLAAFLPTPHKFHIILSQRKFDLLDTFLR